MKKIATIITFLILTFNLIAQEFELPSELTRTVPGSSKLAAIWDNSQLISSIQSDTSIVIKIDSVVDFSFDVDSLNKFECCTPVAYEFTTSIIDDFGNVVKEAFDITVDPYIRINTSEGPRRIIVQCLIKRKCQDNRTLWSIPIPSGIDCRNLYSRVPK